MSGILGVWHLDGRPIDSKVFDRMAARQGHRGPDGERRWARESVALACQFMHIAPESAADRQPLEGDSGAVVLFDGRLDNREELLPELSRRKDLSLGSPDSAIVLAAYEAYGEEFVKRLNGDFALAVYDPVASTMLLARDAIGVRPLHYCQVGESFLFASEIKAILAYPEVALQFNEKVLSSYLLLRNVGLDETFFKNVHCLPPAHLMVVARGAARVYQYWDFDPFKTIRFSSYAEYVEAFRSLFEQAVRRRMRSAYPVGVAVSGGIDSSAVFCMAQTLRRQSPGLVPELVGISHTVNDGSPADEERYLKEIERQYQVTIERVPEDPPGVYEGCLDEVWHSETPLVNNIWSSWRRIHSRMKDLGVRVLLTGDYADNWLADEAYLLDLLRQFSWKEVWRCIETTCQMPEAGSRSKLYRWYGWYFFRDCVEPLIPVLRRLRYPGKQGLRAPPYYTRHVIDKAGRSRTSGPAAMGSAHFQSLYKIVRDGYVHMCLQWRNKVSCAYTAQMSDPFLDRDLLSYILSIPGTAIRPNGAWKGILLDALPGVLPEALLLRRTKGDYTSVMTGGVQRDVPAIVSFLQFGLASRFGYTYKEKIERFCREVVKEAPLSMVRSRRILDLLGLEALLQVFSGLDQPGRL